MVVMGDDDMEAQPQHMTLETELGAVVPLVDNLLECLSKTPTKDPNQRP